MMLYLDNAPKRAIRLASLVVALILCTNVWADDDTAVTDPQCEGDDVPKADSPSHDPSSFAAGCGANANGDGSVAIGHKATTERVNVDENLFLAKGTVTVEGKSIDIVVQYDEPGGKEIGYYYDKNKDGKIDLEEHDKAESIAAIVHTLDPIPDDSLVPDHMLDVKGTTVERLEEIVPVKNAVAIGPNAAVKGDGGIALGNGATVGRDGKVIDVAVVKEDDVIANGIITVEGKSIDIVVQYDEPGGKEIGYYYDKNKDGKIDLEEHDKAESIAAIVHTLDPNPDDSLVPDHMLDVKGTRQVTNIEVESMVVDDIPATNGIAIGNGAAVMGDNGIAIGAGAEAEKNQIVIGTSDHSVAMIAGVDIKKARGDITTNATNITTNATNITTNATNITTNATNIAANTGRITTNEGGTAANASAIADFNDRLLGVDERVKQVAAMSAALSAVPNAVSGDGDFFLGVGFGNSGGEQGIAVGVSARFGAKKNIVINAGAASAGDETSVRAGVGFVW